METLINNITWMLECFMIIICCHITNVETIRFNLMLAGLVLSNNVIFNLAYHGVLPVASIYITYLMLFVYFLKMTKRKLLDKIVRFVAGILLAGVLELVVMFVISLIEPLRNAQLERNLIGCFITVFITIAILYKILQSKQKVTFGISSKQAVLVTIICAVLFGILVFDYWIFHVMNRLTNLFFAIIAICIGAYFYLLQKKKQQLNALDLELDLYKKYGEPYEALVKEVRKQQHDYKNQLATLHSMQMVATDINELEEMQTNYSMQFNEHRKYEEILTCCNHSIMAGYLYYRCIELEKDNLKVDYKINVEQAECKMPIHEILEVLGIFLDNAKEFLKSHSQYVPCIGMKVWEDNEGVLLSIRNQSEFLTSGDIEAIFTEGYSTKGKNRGIGLYRVKQLAETYAADLVVENCQENNCNWIEFRMLIGKETGGQRK